MFKTIREQTDLVEVISHFVDEDTKAMGESVILESDTCPLCGHKECFRIKQDGVDSFYKCFSCDKSGDAVKFVEEYKNLSPVDSCKLIAKEFSITLPTGSPIQEIFTLAARYYRNCFIETCDKPYPELGGLSPLQYQTQIRGHKESTLEFLQIGWSDGGLIDYLRGTGVDDEMLAESGLMNKANKDFLPSKAFIYPHLVKGRVSHFTFKDPLKKLAYQLKNSSKLNGHSWYNQDAIKDSDTVILVEGENDLASIIDSDWRNVIASIGSIGGTQIEWLVNNCASKHIITLFDPDDAGEKYREKLHKAKSKFLSLKQVIPTDDKDIDELLRSGKVLGEIISTTPVEQTSKESILSALGVDTEALPDESEVATNDEQILVNNNCYFRLKINKDGEYKPVKLSNFIISLRNVFIHDNNRSREVILTRADGKVSRPVTVSSEIKTSLKQFRTFVANTIDASFYGSEADLTAVWEFVYSRGRENEVHLIDYVGRNEYGWIFHNCLVTHTGRIVEADGTGTFWRDGRGEGSSTGIKAISINSLKSFDDNELDIPSFNTSLDEEEREAFLGEFIKNLSENLNNPGLTILIAAWARAVAYCDWFVDTYGHFPYVYFCGGKGRGKTTIIDWVLDLYNMSKCGHIKLPNVRSLVALERKIAYYSSLPICIDELRNDKQTQEYSGTFRSWYDRSGRELGTNQDSTSIKTLPIRACIFFGGQDTISDPATKERAIPIRLPDVNTGRNMIDTWNWMKVNKEKLSSIGYHWIIESQKKDLYDLKEKLEDTRIVLQKSGVSTRYSINFALLKVLGEDLCKQYFPKFDWCKFVRELALETYKSTEEEDILYQFFSFAESLTIGDHPRINTDNYRVEGNVLTIWLNSVYNEVSKEMKHVERLRDDFTKNSLIEMLKEQDWFISKDTKKRIGIDNKLRYVLTIDLDKAPDYIKVFASYTKKDKDNEKD